MEIKGEIVMRGPEMDHDWYSIERKEHDGRVWVQPTQYGSMQIMSSARISDANVEGTAAEMRAIARAIRERGSADFERCAVDVNEKDGVAGFCSPRNSSDPGIVALAEADKLAEQIERELGASR